MNQTLDEIVADPSNKIHLDDKERSALAYWQASKQPDLAPAKRVELMALYLRGYSTDQIRKEHPVFTLGQIVHAKIVDRWDLAIEQYALRLRDSMIDQVTLTTMETARTLVDVLAAANHFLGVKARKYLETNNPADLPFPIDKVRDYQALIASYQMVIGGPPKKVEHSVTGGAAPTQVQAQVVVEGEEEDEDSKVLALMAGEVPEQQTLAEKVKGAKK